MRHKVDLSCAARGTVLGSASVLNESATTLSVQQVLPCGICPPSASPVWKASVWAEQSLVLKLNEALRMMGFASGQECGFFT